MTVIRSDFLNVLLARGFIHQCTDMCALDAQLSKGKPVTAYIGFDATASSLHVGSLLPIMMLRWLQKCGGKPIVLMGGGTSKVGDPSGKDESRKLLTNEQIAVNIAGIKQVFDKFLAFGNAPCDALMVNNADWLDGLGYIDFLRRIGPHFTLNRMLTFDSVRLRLEREHPLSFLEFNYMILQAYDFVQLFQKYDCSLQMGGSDQWGNIVSGIDLGRRLAAAEGTKSHLIGLTAPLMTTASGVKMGKTAKGAVWLNADRLTPYDYWQFWRNTEDADVGRFLRLFTELPLGEIIRLESLQGTEINEAKKTLASEATSLAHGKEAAISAAETARKTFEEGKAGDDLPVIEIRRAQLNDMMFIEMMKKVGLVASNSEARRLIRGGGARLDDQPVSDENTRIPPQRLKVNVTIKISAGKKRHALVKVKE